MAATLRTVEQSPSLAVNMFIFLALNIMNNGNRGGLGEKCHGTERSPRVFFFRVKLSSCHINFQLLADWLNVFG